MATIDISPAAGTPASTGYLIYTDATTGTFKKAPLSALPLSDTMVTALAAKQATLVSGTNIKTLDGTDLLGSGDIPTPGGINDPFTAHTGTTWNGALKYRVLNANLALTLVTALQSGMILFKQDGTGGRTVSIEGEDLPINLDPGKWSSVGFTKAGSEYLIMVNPTIISVTPAADVTPPGIVRLEAIDGTHIEAELDENVTTTGFTGWSFKKNGSAFVPSGVSGGGTDTLTFTFATSILDSDTLLASYNSGTGDTEDTSGNELVSFTDSAVTNSVDSTAPTITVRQATSTTTIALTFSEAVTETGATGFTAKVNGGSAIAATSISGSGTTRTLTFPSSSFSGSDTITLSYALTGDVADLAGNDLAAFTDAAVTNSFATTLNAPISFAAGTPTADGCPSTWTDTNTSPNESSYLIQIAAGADTTFTTILATRTPAANATSDAGGTTLTASTAYRMRIIAVGNGSTTLNSAPSNVVTFTTAASSTTVPLTFPGLTPVGGVITPGETAYAVLHRANETLAGDGYLEMDVTSIGGMIGMRTTNSTSGDFTSLNAAIFFSASGSNPLDAVDGGSAVTSPAPLGTAPSGGIDTARITRSGSTFTAQYYASGVATGPSYTFGFTSSAPMFIFCTSNDPASHIDNATVTQ